MIYGRCFIVLEIGLGQVLANFRIEVFAQVPQPLWVFQAGHLCDLVDTNAFIEPLHQYRVADHLGPDARRWLRLDRLAGLQDQIPADMEQRSHGDLGGLLGDEKAGEWMAVAGIDRRILGARPHSLQAFEHVALGEPEQQGIANALIERNAPTLGV